jgi:hypothetical protein
MTKSFMPLVLLLVVLSIGGVAWAGMFSQDYQAINQTANNTNSPVYGSYVSGVASTTIFGTLLSIAPFLVGIAILVVVLLSLVAITKRRMR